MTAMRATLFLIGLGLAPFALCQSQSGETARTHACKLEVTSIHESKRDHTPRLSDRGDGTILQGLNTSPLDLLLRAFLARDKQYLAGYPSWVESDAYDLLAKIPLDEISTHCLSEISGSSEAIRHLLQERFALKFHTEERQIQIFALIIAKGGPKLKPSTATSDFIAKNPDGQYFFDNPPPTARVQYGDIRKLIGIISGAAGHQVLDQTGITGRYDFVLKWDSWSAPWWPPDWPLPQLKPGDEAGPPIFTAVREQLGLELRPIKVKVPVTVIDHIERPSPN